MSAGDDRSPSGPSPEPSGDEDQSLLTRFLTAESGPLMFIREVLTSIASVALVGLLLFAVSGVWPPMVAVESGSMEPHMQKGDLVFITEPGRLMPAYTHEQSGVVTYRTGKEHDYRTFGSYGSVIVYDNPKRPGPPIIHRARFYVQEGENWYPRANSDFIRADSCAELLNCPAPHAGFITKGDANRLYDQANGISGPVKPEWVVGVARIRIPFLGWVRLGFSGAMVASPVDVAAAGTVVDARSDAAGFPTATAAPTTETASMEPPYFDSTAESTPEISALDGMRWKPTAGGDPGGPGGPRASAPAATRVGRVA